MLKPETVNREQMQSKDEKSPEEEKLLPEGVYICILSYANIGLYMLTVNHL